MQLTQPPHSRIYMLLPAGLGDEHAHNKNTMCSGFRNVDPMRQYGLDKASSDLCPANGHSHVTLFTGGAPRPVQFLTSADMCVAPGMHSSERLTWF